MGVTFDATIFLLFFHYKNSCHNNSLLVFEREKNIAAITLFYERSITLYCKLIWCAINKMKSFSHSFNTRAHNHIHIHIRRFISYLIHSVLSSVAKLLVLLLVLPKLLPLLSLSLCFLCFLNRFSCETNCVKINAKTRMQVHLTRAFIVTRLDESLWAFHRRKICMKNIYENVYEKCCKMWRRR